MASANTPSAKGGKRSLEAEVNLVPFIDLLSMCICFLLITAVWVQTASIDVKQTHGTSAATPTPTQKYEMEVKFTGPTAIQVLLKSKGGIAKTAKYVGKTIEELTVQLDQGLSTVLGSLVSKSVKAAGPVDGQNLISSATVSPNARVPYGNMVAVMDQMRKHKIINLGVLPQ